MITGSSALVVFLSVCFALQTVFTWSNNHWSDILNSRGNQEGVVYLEEDWNGETSTKSQQKQQKRTLNGVFECLSVYFHG